MTYGRWLQAGRRLELPARAAVSHLAELARGDLALNEGPLIRPLRGTFSPRGEGSLAGRAKALICVREKASIRPYTAARKKCATWHL
jgi:hypothetical protein